jgi:hypothetical protein
MPHQGDAVGDGEGGQREPDSIVVTAPKIKMKPNERRLYESYP